MSKFYRKRLPHFQPSEGTFFITYRLEGSIPKEIIQEYSKLPNRKEILKSPETKNSWIFRKIDKYLDHNPNGPYWLSDERVAALVKESLLFHHGKYYDLHSFCIMSNHVHVLLTSLKGAPELYKILQSHKSYTARMANSIFGRSGKFWESESNDNLIRSNSHFQNVLKYILNNPVKAGLVNSWKDWQFTWLAPQFVGFET